MSKFTPDSEKVRNRAFDNAVDNMTTTDIWDAFNSAGLEDFEILLDSFKTKDVEKFSITAFKIVNDYIEDELLDTDKAFVQLHDEHDDKGE